MLQVTESPDSNHSAVCAYQLRFATRSFSSHSFFFFNLLTRLACVPLIANITTIHTESIKSLADVVCSTTRLITDVCTSFSKGVARAIFAPRK